MKQIRQSPHYPKAREQFAKHEKADPARDKPEKLAGECHGGAAALDARHQPASEPATSFSESSNTRRLSASDPAASV